MHTGWAWWRAQILSWNWNCRWFTVHHLLLFRVVQSTSTLLSSDPPSSVFKSWSWSKTQFVSPNFELPSHLFVVQSPSSSLLSSDPPSPLLYCWLWKQHVVIYKSWDWEGEKLRFWVFDFNLPPFQSRVGVFKTSWYCHLTQSSSPTPP